MFRQVVEASFNKLSDNEIYNVGGETHSLCEVAELIANKYGAEIVSETWPDRDSRLETGSTYFDDRKIKELLGTGIEHSIALFLNEEPD